MSLPQGITVTVDMLHGATQDHPIIEGRTIVRMALVSGLDSVMPLPFTDTGTILTLAEEYLTSVVGPRGSECPNVPVLTYLERFEGEVLTTGDVQFKIIYKGFPAGQLEFSASLSSVESNIDADGNVITVQYTYPTDATTYIGDPRWAGKTITQGGLITRQAPELTYTVKLTVTGGLVAVTNIVSLEGGTNMSAYAVGSIQGAPRTWLVTAVRALSRDGGFTFELSFSIQYRESTWDQTAMFINPGDGKPPPNLVQGTGYKTVKTPPAVNFPLFVFAPN